LTRTLDPEVETAAIERFLTVIPDAENVLVRPAPPPMFSISFDLDGERHGFRLRREDRKWTVREHVRDHVPVPSSKDSEPRFEDLIRKVLGYQTESGAGSVAPEPVRSSQNGHQQVRIRVVDMRCPVDSRRLFGKLITTGLVPDDLAKLVHMEFSCSLCKRLTGEVTMHRYNARGEHVKTEAIEPWVKREPQPWHQSESANA
jgi:hypothetical protein